MANSYTKLTPKQIVLMPVGACISESGITAKKMKNGHVSFSINVMIDGQRIHRTVGMSNDGTSRGDAERLVARLKTEAREGRLKLQKNRKLAMSFAEVSVLYLAKMDETDGKNIRRKKQQIKTHLLPFFAKFRVDAITASDVATFTKSLTVRQNLSVATANRYLATLSHIFSVASSPDNRWMSKDDVPSISLAGEGEGRRITLSSDEIVRLLAAALEDVDPQLYLFVLAGLHSSGRHGEIVAHTWKSFVADRHRIFVPRAKAGPRVQPLTAPLTEALIAEKERQQQLGLYSDDGFIFLPGPGSQTPHRRSFASSFKRAVIRAGLNPKQITPHVLRHTAITDLVSRGISLALVKLISGHKTVKMVLRYFHASDPAIDAAIAVLAA